MNIVRAIFSKIRAIFLKFWKRAGETSPLPPSSYSPTENEISKVKTKLRNTCKKYCHVKVPYKENKIISNLSNRKDKVTLKQDKGRAVVIMDRSNYTEKYMSLLWSNQLNIFRMTLQNHWNQKYNRQFEKLSQNCLNKSTRNCIQLDSAKVNFMESPRYTNSQ